jgi:hypothetical protein
MSEDSSNSIYISDQGAPRWVAMAIIALAAVSILGLGIAWNATTHAQSAEQALVAQDNQSSAIHQSIATIGQRLAQSEEINAQLQAELRLVTDRLKVTQGELANARLQARQIRTEYSQKFDTMHTEMAAKADSDALSSMGTDVSGVRTDLESTRNSLEMARGEFGTLIARNSEEIEQLRSLGQRDYFEFAVVGKGKRARVGNLMVELRGTDVKRHQFTVAIYMDDLRIEKKNRAADEPIYFYTRGARAPFELVVNRIAKDQIAGYLSAPKIERATPMAATTTSGN